MGFKKGSKSQIQTQKTNEIRSQSSSSIINDSFILSIMCLIGLSVDVHIKDGSVYSGILFTASVDHHYGIVLKRAQKMKKGSCDSNVINGEIIGTLIIQSEDLVQVVAKRELISSNAFAAHKTGDVTGTVASTPLTETNQTMTVKSNIGLPQTNQTRCSFGTENRFANVTKPEITINVSNNPEITKSENIREVEENASKVKEREPSVSPSSSLTPTESVTSKLSNPNPTTKEFKLNPGAKIFSPSFPNKRSPPPPLLMPAGEHIAYIPNNYPAVPTANQQTEIEISAYGPRSLPVKFVPYGGNDVQHTPPIVGYMTNRSQPVRFSAQYHHHHHHHHPVQTTPTYIQPASQNVMPGRVGPLVYVHHVSQGMVPNTNGFPQMSTHSILTPPQVHFPKHQGTVIGQAFPPFIGGGGQTQFVLPNHIPISQPPYLIIRPISIPGANRFVVSNFS